jgi:hypothetical protein
MEKPKNTKAEILLTAIENGSVSIMDFPYLSGFRTRISEINSMQRVFNTRMKKGVNKYGRVYNYAVHYIENTEASIDLYGKINK